MELSPVPATTHPQTGDYSSKANEITLLIRRLMQADKIYSKQLSRKYQVSTPQMNCLLTLYDNGALQPTQIARNIAVKGSTVTGIVDRLEKKGMVVRFRNLQDRRRIGIQLTNKGRKFVEDGPRPLREYIEHGLKDLSASEADRIVQALIRLTGMLEKQENHLKSPPDRSPISTSNH